jgi:hypothetical protein
MAISGNPGESESGDTNHLLYSLFILYEPPSFRRVYSIESNDWEIHSLLEGLTVLADRYGECHQFLEGFIGSAESDSDRSGSQFHAFREPVEIVQSDLANLGIGYLDQHRRLPYPFAAHLVQVSPELFLAALFVISALSGGHVLELSDDVGAISHQAGSDAPPGDWSQKLLSAAAANTEERLKGKAVNPWIGGVLQLHDGRGDAVEPKRLIRHRRISRYVAV